MLAQITSFKAGHTLRECTVKIQVLLFLSTHSKNSGNLYRELKAYLTQAKLWGRWRIGRKHTFHPRAQKCVAQTIYVWSRSPVWVNLPTQKGSVAAKRAEGVPTAESTRERNLGQRAFGLEHTQVVSRAGTPTYLKQRVAADSSSALLTEVGSTRGPGMCHASHTYSASVVGFSDSRGKLARPRACFALGFP